MKALGRFIVVVCVLCVVSGCSEKAEEQVEKVVLPGDETTLALVNDSPVTAYELELVANKTIGEKNAARLGDTGREKILESLVASRAISQAYEKKMTPEEGEELRKKLAAYREQLLVQKYIAKHASPEPVTHEMVKNYYDSHPEQFGASTQKVYELISTSRKLRYQERDRLLKSLVDPEKRADWDQWVREMTQAGLPVFYKKGEAVDGLLHPQLDSAIRALGRGEVSKLHFIDGRPHLARVVDVKMIQPRPLTEVGTRIRKILGPLQLKEAVRDVSADVLRTARVEYMRK